MSVLELRRNDVIATRLGPAQVLGWSWQLRRGQVRVVVTLADGLRHVEIFTDDDFALRRPSARG